MAVPGERERLHATSAPLDAVAVAKWARAGLALSIILMATAPLIVGRSYSVVVNTLSQAGGQGVSSAWAQRGAVLITAAAVTALTAVADPVWGRASRAWLRLYAGALLLLIVLPASSWDVNAPNVMAVAKAHTASAVLGGVAFVLGIVTVSRTRPDASSPARALDWCVALAVVLIPPLMLLSSFPGLLQRLMVALGYVWLLVESRRIELHHSSFRPQTP